MDLLLARGFLANFSNVRHELLWRFALSFQVSLATLAASPANGQNISRACHKVPEIATQPRTPLEYRGKWKKGHVQGRVAIAVDEDGHVFEAKLVEAFPKEAADALLATAKTIAFKPRPGCGTFKTEMIFSVSE